MKLFLFAILLTIFTAIAFADDFPKNSIEVDPVNLALGGVYEIRYERSINGMFGLFAEYGYRYKQTIDDFMYQWAPGTWNGFDVAVGTRFYPNGKYRGLYLAGAFEYRHVEFANNGEYYNEMSPGIKVGYKWLFFGHIPLSLGAGASVPIQDWHITYEPGSAIRESEGSIRPIAEVMVGFSF